MSQGIQAIVLCVALFFLWWFFIKEEKVVPKSEDSCEDVSVNADKIECIERQSRFNRHDFPV